MIGPRRGICAPRDVKHPGGPPKMRYTTTKTPFIAISCMTASLAHPPHFFGLGSPGGRLGSSGATAVSADGTTVVGWSSSNPSGPVEAFRWTATTGILGLGFSAGTTSSEATAVSADGSVVVGFEPFNGTAAWLWTESAGFSILAVPQQYDWCRTTDISNDGQTVVGLATRILGPCPHDPPFGGNRYRQIACRWDVPSGFVQTLPPSSGGFTSSS